MNRSVNGTCNERKKQEAVVSSVAEEGYKKNVGDNRNIMLFGSVQHEQKATQDTEDQKSDCYTTS